MIPHFVIVFLFATTFPTNMAGYFKSLYQSIGEFQRYSRIMNATTGITFLINLLLLFVVRTDDFRLYLLLYVLLNLVIWLFLELYLRKSCKFQFSYTVFSAMHIFVSTSLRQSSHLCMSSRIFVEIIFVSISFSSEVDFVLSTA